MKKADKVNISLAKLSFAVSIIALGTSIYFGSKTTVYTQRQIELDELSQKSKLVARITINDAQKTIEFQQINTDESRAIYRQQYILVLNNIGHIDVSITDMDITLLNKRLDSDSVTFQKFSGMDPTFLDFDGSRIDLPIFIEPNKPMKLMLEVGVKIPKASWEKLPDSIQYNRAYNYKNIEQIFLTTGHPFMGQLDSIDDISYGDKGNLQEYILIITKGDGSLVSVQFLHNVSDYLQGESK